MALWDIVFERFGEEQSELEAIFTEYKNSDDFDASELTMRKSDFNNTLLHLLLANEAVEASKALLKVFLDYIDFSLYDVYGRSALTLSFISGDEALSLSILEKTPKKALLKKDALGITPLQAAVYFGMEKVFHKLVTVLCLTPNEIMGQLVDLTDEMCELLFQQLSIDGRRDKAARHSFFVYEGCTFSLSRECFTELGLKASLVTPEEEGQEEGEQYILVTLENFRIISDVFNGNNGVSLEKVTPNRKQLTGISFRDDLKGKREKIIDNEFNVQLSLVNEYRGSGLFSVRSKEPNVQCNSLVTVATLFYMSCEGGPEQAVLIDHRVP